MTKKNSLFLLGLLISVITIQAQPTEEIQKLLAGDGGSFDSFGFSVSISGNYAIVGTCDNDYNSSAYIYYNNSGTWEQQAKLTASDGAAFDYFGISVSISGDYAVVGAYLDDDNCNDSGSAYIFKKPGTDWTNMTQTAKLTASDGAIFDYFGSSVSISGDCVIVGTYADYDNGSAYIFEKPETGWTNMTQTAILTASDGAAYDRFGRSVSISGNYAVVGALGDDDNGNSSGSAYIFEKPGTTWTNMTQTAKLTASDGAAYDNFGRSVSISGNYAVVGASGDDDNGNYSGSAYIFEKPGTDWTNMTQTAKLTASDGAANDYFGKSVSISGDYAVVGAYEDDDNDSGSAYIFEKPGTDWTNMTQTAKLTASDGAADDYFGRSVSISGNYAVVGASGDDDNGAESGSAYIFGTPLPNITSQPDDQTCVRINDNVSFSVAGDYIDTKQWQVSTDSGNTWTNLTDDATYTGTTTYTLTVTTDLSLDSNQYSCTVANAYGTDISDAAVLTLDLENPVTPTLANITGECSATATVPTTTDNCAGTITGTTSDPLEYTEQGTYTITWVFDDENGNSIDVEQNVTVEDITDPTITCVSNQEVDADESNTYTVAGTEFDPPETGDNCELASVINNYNNSAFLAGETLPAGTTAVTWTVTDIAGNTATCSFDIQVNAFVGVNELSELGISIYPNPSNGIFTIEAAGNYNVSLIDITGKLVNELSINNTDELIDLRNQPKGVYFVIFKNEKTVSTAKIIID